MANKTSDEKQTLRCSFCNKTQDQVRKLIAGPNVFICDECIDICAEIIEEEFSDDYDSETGINLLKPKEIKDFLDGDVIGWKQANIQKRLTKILDFAIPRWDFSLVK